MISSINIAISRCTTGIYLKWFYNGYHYFNFTNGYEITMQTESMGTQVTKMFSRISKIERPTKLKAEYSYQVSLEGITAGNIPGFEGLLLAERVEQYESGLWREVEITRGEHVVKDENGPGYIFNFEITRKELPNTPAVFQKSQHLFINDTECDLDEDELIPINKQVNDIAEMQDRQSDFTAQFKIRKTRAMRALFELSGEVGANTTFPYENQSCRLVQNGIEMITGGIMVLDKTDDQYYYVSILSGNLNFFKDIETLKITDLTLASSDHTWNIASQKLSHDHISPETDYLYPLLEPSDDAGMTPLKLVGNTVELYGGWIWPFVRVETIWNEIFANSGFICDGDILTNDTFLKLFMPITSLKITNTQKYLYSAWWQGSRGAVNGEQIGFPGAVLINGDDNFRQGYYYLPYNATYKFKVTVIGGNIFTPPPTLSVYKNGAYQGDMAVTGGTTLSIHEYTVAGTSGQHVEILTTAYQYYYYSSAVIEIVDSKISYGSVVTPRLHLPDMTQIDFIKTICNMFGLIPDVTARDKKIKFWNYSDLYDNIPVARDWSAYLSEREDETEFKFGDYAQKNYLRYKESKDVVIDNGRGAMLINDETLPLEKDVVDLPLSTCDEITIAFTAPEVNVSRIDMNKWDNNTVTWKASDSIDPRIVYVKRATGKVFKVWDTVAMNINSETVNDPKIASSMDVSFSSLVVNYAWLSRMLTKTNLRRAKFNLPVYEVAGLKHYIPIYLNQYKAYFYVNKINNYVPGQLCTIDLIKL
jgi:hypothetical protein